MNAPPSRLEPTTGFSLAKHAGEYVDWPRTTPLLRHGLATGAEVAGYQLLRQYSLGDSHTLLVTDWDCPFEESTNVVLLDATLRVKATKSFGVPYSSFWLTDARIAGARVLELELSDQVLWRIEVLKRRPWLAASVRNEPRPGAKDPPS